MKSRWKCSSCRTQAALRVSRLDRSAIVRVVVREELRSALAEHRQQERERETEKLLPLPEAARKLNLTAKALRSRIERGSVPGAQRVGSRWHIPLKIAPEDDERG